MEDVKAPPTAGRSEQEIYQARLHKAEALRALGVNPYATVPGTGPRRHRRGREGASAAGRPAQLEAHASRPARHRRTHPRRALLRQGRFPEAARPHRRAAGLREARRAGGGGLRDRQARRGGRHRRRGGQALSQQDRRADPAGRELHRVDQGPAPAAREMAWPARPRDPLPAALPRPDRQRGDSNALLAPQPDRQGDPRLPRCPRVRRGRDADDARARLGRRGPPLRDPPQRPGSRPLSAHRPRAVPQAAGGRRVRAGLRDQPQLPQRGAEHPAQPRVHHAGVLLGLRHLRRSHGLDRGAASPTLARNLLGSTEVPTRARRSSFRGPFRRLPMAEGVREAFPSSRPATRRPRRFVDSCWPTRSPSFAPAERAALEDWGPAS